MLLQFNLSNTKTKIYAILITIITNMGQLKTNVAQKVTYYCNSYI